MAVGEGAVAGEVGDDENVVERPEGGIGSEAVSYTHLTLPTSDLV